MENRYDETLLDDIFIRSQRLEFLTQFQVQLPLSNILHSTRLIQRDQNSGDAIRNGQLFLASKEEFPRASEIIKNIKIEPSKEIFMSFNDRSQECYQTAIVSSILKARKSTSDEFHNFFNESMKKDFQCSDLTVDQSVITMPLNHIEGRYLKDSKMELTMYANAYITALSNNQNDIFEGFLNAVPTYLFSFLGENQMSFYDNFRIMNILKKNINDIKKGALEFLEIRMKRFIQNEVNSNLTKAKRGGTIGIIQAIQGYLNLQRHKFYQSSWAVIYYALRCGELQAALEFTLAHNSDFDKDVRIALQLRAEGHDIDEKRRNSLASYLTREATSISCDPFKVLSLSILTKIKNSIPENDVIQTIDDWLWLRLQLVDDIEDIAEEFKEKKVIFSDPANPFLHGQILMLIGQFEEAAKWFLSCNNNVQCNLHIVLLMHITKFIGSELLFNEFNSPLLDYAMKVFPGSPTNAIRYLSYINNKDERINAIAQLIVDVDNGSIVFDSRNEMSSISQFLVPTEQNAVLELAAQKSKMMDQIEKANEFYILLGDYKSVVELECNQLCQYIEGFFDIDIIPKTITVYNDILDSGINVPPQLFEDFRILLRISCACRFIRNISKENKIDSYQKAINEIEAADIIPLSKSRVYDYLERANNYSSYLQRIIPTTLYVALNSYVNLYNLINNRNENLKEKGESLISFAGSISYLPMKIQKEILDLSLEFD